MYEFLQPSYKVIFHRTLILSYLGEKSPIKVLLVERTHAICIVLGTFQVFYCNTEA